jgi:hypothetical protein
VTIGTVFEDSHIPLRKWLIAWYLLCSSKKGISSLQLQRLLELGSYRSALFMAHRIRYALKETAYPDKLSGIIEADEALIGGLYPQAKGVKSMNKTPVMALVQRGGPVRSMAMPTIKCASSHHDKLLTVLENLSPELAAALDSRELKEIDPD